MRSRVSGRTSAYPFSARETVPTDTPLRRASCRMVTFCSGIENGFGTLADSTHTTCGFVKGGSYDSSRRRTSGRAANPHDASVYVLFAASCRECAATRRVQSNTTFGVPEPFQATPCLGRGDGAAAAARLGRIERAIGCFHQLRHVAAGPAAGGQADRHAGRLGRRRGVAQAPRGLLDDAGGRRLAGTARPRHPDAELVAAE